MLETDESAIIDYEDWLENPEEHSSMIENLADNELAFFEDTEEHDDDIEEEEEDEDEDEEGEHDEDDEDDEDEEDDEMDHDDSLSSVRHSLGLHMHSLFGGAMPTQLNNILDNLSNFDDKTQQLIALQELAETLSMSNEEALSSFFQCDAFVRQLVKILKGPETQTNSAEDDMMLALAMSEGYGSTDPELMLLACRCISNLLDALPSSISSIVSQDTIGILCGKLKSIEYIDLAEQALGALEKVAGQAPKAVVQNGGLSAALMYFDFFSIHSQRTALRTASHCLKNIGVDASSQVMEIIPVLSNTLTYSDRTVVELTCLCWARLSESYRSYPEAFEKVVSVDLLKTMIGLLPISGNSNAVRPASFNDLLRVFRSVSKASPMLGYQLLTLNINHYFYHILSGTNDQHFKGENIGENNDNSNFLNSSITLDTKWRDSINMILKISIDLLPSLPKDGIFNGNRFLGTEPVALRTRSSKLNNVEPESSSSSTATAPVSTSATITKTTTVKPDPRIESLKNNPQLLKRDGAILFPLLLEIYSSTVNLRLRLQVTQALVKYVFFMDADTLKSVLKHVPLSGFLVGLLTQREHSTLVINSLFQAELLLVKLPSIYFDLFRREGVLYEIKELASLPLVEDNGKSSQQQYSEMASSQIINDDASNMSDAKSESGRSQLQGLSSQSQDEDNTNESIINSRRRQAMRNSDFRLSSLWKHGLLLDKYNNIHFKANMKPSNREGEPGIGHGSLRRFIIQLAQNFIKTYDNMQDKYINVTSNTIEELQMIAEQLSGSDDDPSAIHVLKQFSSYINETEIGISGFELYKSGILDGLVNYLTQKDNDENVQQFKSSLDKRQQTFYSVFLETLKLEEDKNIIRSPELHVLTKRLEELFTRFEQFEVISPLDSSAPSSSSSSSLSSDFTRHPIQLLAKQLRIRLTGQGTDIPSNYKEMMVALHAVATFRVLEEYLLTRIEELNKIGLKNANESSDEEDIEDDNHEHKYSNNDVKPMDIDNSEETTTKDSNLHSGVSIKNSEKRTVAPSRRATLRSQTASSSTSAQPSSSTKNSKTKSKSKSKTTVKPKGTWRIQFYIKDKLISNDSTIYGAIHKYEHEFRQSNKKIITHPNLWTTAYPITFKRVFILDDDTEKVKNVNTPKKQLDKIVIPKQLIAHKDSSPCMSVLKLLKALVNVCHSWQESNNDGTTLKTSIHGKVPLLPTSDFINRKLTAKLQRQLEEPLIVASSCLPEWVYYFMSDYPFLFPFDIRYLFIQSTSFGYSRLITRWQSLEMRNNTQNGQRADRRGYDDGVNGSNHPPPTLGRIERRKVKVKRDQILESAIKFMDLFGSSQSILEIEYADEEGTGLGPTLEFYASASKEFCKKSTNMWRQDNDEGGENGGDNNAYVVAKQGLFPAPLYKGMNAKSHSKIIHLFKSLGQFVAKAMLDFRIIDIPFSVAFFKLLLNNDICPFDLVQEIDTVLGKSLLDLKQYADKKKQIGEDSTLTDEQKLKLINDIQINGAKIEDLCLDFTLPGHDAIELKGGGSNINVTIFNVEEYIQLLADAIAGSGVKEQIKAFREGFNGLFAIDDLKVLTYQELVSLFGSSTEDWSFSGK
ncbi:unnamed protein product [Cunninghamella echinulata]